MYDKDFAKIYNKDWAWFSANLAKNVLNLDIKKESVLDLGCGTGNFLQNLENYFDNSIGIDLSEPMINIAKQNCKKSQLFIGNILDFHFGKNFDLITCNFDMINHLNSIDEYLIVFKNVFNHLKKGGIFLFDFNTSNFINNINTELIKWEDDDTIKTSQDTLIDDNHAMFEIKVYNKQNKLIASINEVESFYDYKTIENALKQAKFNNILFCDKDLKETENFSAKRLFVMCKK